MAVHVCNASYTGGIAKRIVVYSQPRQIFENLSEK
jgi:hypothetical protein